MTRINVGICPSELCDVHLRGEYRELPRAFNTRTNSTLKHFRLGTGHQLWCAKYQWSLWHRQMRICDEMLHRGYNVNYPITWADVDACDGRAWSNHDEEFARPLLQERILERMQTIKTLVWTNREPPDWVVKAAHEHPEWDLRISSRYRSSTRADAVPEDRLRRSGAVVHHVHHLRGRTGALVPGVTQKGN